MYAFMIRVGLEFNQVISKNINIVLGIVFLCIGLFMLCNFFLSSLMYIRGKRILRFRKLVLETLTFALVCDWVCKQEVEYEIGKVWEYMWSLERMVYSFWIKDNRKMFYVPEVYDYILPYLEFVASDQGQKLLSELREKLKTRG